MTSGSAGQRTPTGIRPTRAQLGRKPWESNLCRRCAAELTWTGEDAGRNRYTCYRGHAEWVLVPKERGPMGPVGTQEDADVY